MPALRSKQTDAERDNTEGQRGDTYVEQHDELIGLGDAFPSRRKEGSGGQEDGRSPDAGACEESEQAAHMRGISKDLAHQGQGH
jgi:hypothetical protein